MRITLGNIDGKALGLNASEACVYAAIEKCSRGDNAKGWYGTMEALAGVLPCRINRMTVGRAIAKLLNLGLIIEMENKYFVNAQTLQNTLQTLQNTLQSAQNSLQSTQNSTQSVQNTLQNTLQTLQNTLQSNAQNVQNDAQNVHENAQNVHENAQNVLPPNNPPINKENKMERENSCTHTPTRDAANPDPSFEEFIELYKNIINVPYNAMMKNTASSYWHLCSRAKKLALMRAMECGEWSKPRPDWCINDFPEPEPKDYNGAQLLPDEPLVIAKHNDRAGLYTRREAELFGMNILKPFVP